MFHVKHIRGFFDAGLGEARGHNVSRETFVRIAPESGIDFAGAFAYPARNT
jgi:hypothetical protein